MFLTDRYKNSQLFAEISFQAAILMPVTWRELGCEKENSTLSHLWRKNRGNL